MNEPATGAERPNEHRRAEEAILAAMAACISWVNASTSISLFAKLSAGSVLLLSHHTAVRSRPSIITLKGRPKSLDGSSLISTCIRIVCSFFAADPLESVF
jgi:hypothetical protein